MKKIIFLTVLLSINTNFVFADSVSATISAFDFDSEVENIDGDKYKSNGTLPGVSITWSKGFESKHLNIYSKSSQDGTLNTHGRTSNYKEDRLDVEFQIRKPSAGDTSQRWYTTYGLRYINLKRYDISPSISFIAAEQDFTYLLGEYGKVYVAPLSGSGKSYLLFEGTLAAGFRKEDYSNNTQPSESGIGLFLDTNLGWHYKFSNNFSSTIRYRYQGFPSVVDFSGPQLLLTYKM